MRDGVIFALCLGAAICADSLPVSLLLAVAALLLSFRADRPRKAKKRPAERAGKGARAMSYYRTCPHCGAHLDPGELCDCRAVSDKGALRIGRAPGGYCRDVRGQKESRPGATNTRGGEVGKATAKRLIPASILGYAWGGCQG
ncbi:hypothetical protein [Vermiculatibacterium agrestimuris]|uniref:hypothetical protein n=1 Tax=Vermiculatibacterium agrestimuris TaxID=2941519 RepID=UPI00203CA8E5|nr:hypothetical protein [Vermiculatibacterium agrestimuris]